MSTRTNADRITLAEQLLAEAVYRSRGLQAVQVGLSSGTSSAGACGLGEEAAVDLELTPHGQELFDELWPQGVPATRAEALRAKMADWVELQDSLDRKRNHFIRDFRRAHGADRREYGPDVAAKYEAGLEKVNREVREACHRAAEELLA